jgi:prepilin peptidase CpaA
MALPMQGVVWWTSATVLVVASGIDIRTRRVPNWLAVPFLVAGLVVQSIAGRLPGAGRSLAGIAVAGLLFGIPCWIGAMGMGDLKLAAGVGAWIGPGQFVTAAIFTALAGGVLAAGWALWHGSLGASLDSAGGLLTPWSRPPGSNGKVRQATAATAIPYVPAIAIGTLLSFLAR